MWFTFGSAVDNLLIALYVSMFVVVGVVWYLFILRKQHKSKPISSLFHIIFSNIQYTATPTALNVNIKVAVGEGEPIESALRRFKREVNKSGHLMDLRHKRYFENSQDRKKRKIVQARFRVRMERMQARRMRKQRT